MTLPADPLVQAAGLFDLAIAALHLGFWRLFRWKEQLKRVSHTNAAVMQVMNLVLTALLAGLGLLCLVHAGQLPSSALGRQLLAGVAALWLFRLLLQPWFFGLRPALSAAFVPVFLLGAALHAAPLLAAH